MTTERRILLGRVIGAFGVSGEVKVQSFTEPVEALLKYRPWTLVHRGNEEIIVTPRGRSTSKGVVARLPEVDDRNAAEALVGAEIYVARDRLPPPQPGQYYWVDLEGLAVQTVDAVSLGRVSHLFGTGSNDVMVVLDGERERLIPMVEPDFVTNVDFAAGLITVDWDPEF